MKFRTAIPDKVRFIDLFGALYYIDWENLPRGGSFFLPTTATAGQVRDALKAAKKHFDFEFETRARREYGRYGVRVWRTY